MTSHPKGKGLESISLLYVELSQCQVLPIMAPTTTSPALDGKSIANVVPVIDFSQFRSSNPDTALETAQKLFAAFRDSGFVYLQNHGLPQEVVDEAFTWVSPC
jgi:non-haem dioxygenase in morphine synthesis N-terminal